MIQSKHLGHTRVMEAVQEILEDRLGDVVKHCKDMTTIEGKPCEVNVKVVVTPNRERTQFGFTISGAAKFSPRKSAEASLYARVEGNSVSFVEFDPDNQLPFE